MIWLTWLIMKWSPLYALFPFRVSAKFGICTIVSVNRTLMEAKMCTFTLESTHFIFKRCPKFSTNPPRITVRYYKPHDGLPLGVPDKPVQRWLQPGGVGGVVTLLGHLRHCSQKGGAQSIYHKPTMTEVDSKVSRTNGMHLHSFSVYVGFIQIMLYKCLMWNLACSK
jgi:hypothetical protein